MALPLCQACANVQKNLQENSYIIVDKHYQCCLCFGILSDPDLINLVTQKAEESFNASGYDGNTFVLALNIPTTMQFRDSLLESTFPESYSSREMSPKNLFSNVLLKSLEQKVGMRGSLNSDLIMTVSLANDEFIKSDVDFFLCHCPNTFLNNGRKRRPEMSEVHQLYTKTKIQEIINRTDVEVLKKYQMSSPTTSVTVEVSFQREGVFIAGRYCKYSRSLPQSPWTADEEIDIVHGNSVSEKIGNILQKKFQATGFRFIASGREDIDVRMLGNGRPFAVNLINAKKTGSLKGLTKQTTLTLLNEVINKDSDISVGPLTVVSNNQAQVLNVGQEEKRKMYSCVCFSCKVITDEMLKRLEGNIPVKIVQKTVVRVLKRRALHDREREIYSLRALRLDDYHFQLKLETQAGTYIKEFVHSDFGRTSPSVGELMGLDADDIDILQLDVERVDLEWPPHKFIP
ncbi:unnamed protein product [Bursaphelenchus okinawaensis]|uniref:tRNA pseudouridine(55) synthase n=1 Tax=Bursaphelenchus okinawaensis TaxID=465554 RepID=A0A811K7W9_9BILA|nr:unnamed protein product [Bursaphelenchus okinawaensis]CAG9093490.1 unnamed protein product [Bursaphelenchus okinawaensis]